MSVVIVLGMHRSGTGMVSQILRLLGVRMGSNLDIHYEDEDFKTLNMDILRQAGGRWYQPPKPEEISKQLWSIPQICKYIDDKKSESLWGWKDPRMCLLLGPLYWRILKNYNVKIIIVRRCVSDVVASLEAREKKRREDPVLLNNWHRLVDLYNQAISVFLKGHPEVLAHFIDYEQYTQPDLQNRLMLIDKLCNFLESKSCNNMAACDIIRCRA